jgi:putative SOS response-associated peptidase YedK
MGEGFYRRVTVCGRFTNTAGSEELTRHVGQGLGVQFRETADADAWNIRPTDPVLAVVAPSGAPEARMLRWSLLPPWATQLRMRKLMFNARCEGIRERGRFAGATIDAPHRALIVADGFYEWERPENPRLKPRPCRFTVEGGRPFAFAAVWATNRRIGDQAVDSCSIITCSSRPNPLVAKVHDRMPVILTEDNEFRAWLSGDLALRDVVSMCTALPADRMGVEARDPEAGEHGATGSE